MPYALIIVGLVLTIAAARGKQGTLFSLIAGDFSGSNNFIFWAASIFAIGAVGYVKDLRPMANAFLALVLVVLVIHNGGVFDKFLAALKGTTVAAPTAAPTLPQASSLGGGSPSVATGQ